MQMVADTWNFLLMAVNACMLVLGKPDKFRKEEVAVGCSYTETTAAYIPKP